MTIFLTSTSPIKLKALKNYLNSAQSKCDDVDTYENTPIECYDASTWRTNSNEPDPLWMFSKDIQTVDLLADPNRPAQPVGYHGGRMCAELRIEQATKQLNADEGDYIVAIENYIAFSGSLPEPIKCWDTAVIIWATGTGKILATSPPFGPKSRCSTVVSKKYVHQACEQSDHPEGQWIPDGYDLGWSVTVGQVINKKYPGIPADNWHHFFGQRKRHQLLTRAIKKTVDIMEQKRQLIKMFKLYPDYPKPGVLFRDMNPLLANAHSFQQLTKLLALWVPSGTTHIAGMESRGFILGAAVAMYKRLPFVPIRKPGKLPGELCRAEYQKEYGTDTLEIQAELLTDDSKVVLIDDVLATGGTASAAAHLVEECGATVLNFIVVDHVPELLPQAKGKLSTLPFTIIL